MDKTEMSNSFDVLPDESFDESYINVKTSNITYTTACSDDNVTSCVDLTLDTSLNTNVYVESNISSETNETVALKNLISSTNDIKILEKPIYNVKTPSACFDMKITSTSSNQTCSDQVKFNELPELPKLPAHLREMSPIKMKVNKLYNKALTGSCKKGVKPVANDNDTNINIPVLHKSLQHKEASSGGCIPYQNFLNHKCDCISGLELKNINGNPELWQDYWQ